MLASLFVGEVHHQTIQCLAHLGEVTKGRGIRSRSGRQLVKAALQGGGRPARTPPPALSSVPPPRGSAGGMVDIILPHHPPDDG